MGPSTASEAFMSFMLLIGAGLLVLLVIGIVVAIVVAASSGRDRDEER